MFGVYKTNKVLYKEIAFLLHKIGMPAHIVGYHYLHTAIVKVYTDQTYQKNVMKRLYPEIAVLNHTSVSAVEKSMRTAIEIAWLRGNHETLYAVFGHSIDRLRAKPGTKEFIAMVVEALKYT